MTFGHSQTCYSSIFTQRWCCPELGRSCLQVSRLQECFGTWCFLRGDPSPALYYGCLLHCSVLNWYWRAARRPLVFLKLDIPPRHGQKATSSGVGFFQKQLPPPKACQNLFHAPGRHFSLLGISILLSITPGASAKSDITYSFQQEIQFLRQASAYCLHLWCLSCSQLWQPSCYPPFIPEEIRAEASALHPSREKPIFCCFKGEAPAFYVKIPPAPVPWERHDFSWKPFLGGTVACWK